MEEFRNYTDTVEVSNLGNVRSGGQLLTQWKDQYYYGVTIDGKGVRVHTMVGRCFPEICGEYQDGYHYHHVNHNQLDNRAENIVCISPSEHRRLHTEEDGVVRPVTAYNQNGEKVGTWGSLTEAQLETYTHQTHIGRVCRGERATAGNMFWIFNDDPDAEAKLDSWKLRCIEKHRRANIRKEGGLLIKLRKAVRDYNEEVRLKRKEARKEVKRLDKEDLWKPHNVVYYDKLTGTGTVYKNLNVLCKEKGLNYATVFYGMNSYGIYNKPTFRITK